MPVAPSEKQKVSFAENLNECRARGNVLEGSYREVLHLSKKNIVSDILARWINRRKIFTFRDFFGKL
jgi:hypothetical protein